MKTWLSPFRSPHIVTSATALSGGPKVVGKAQVSNASLHSRQLVIVCKYYSVKYYQLATAEETQFNLVCSHLFGIKFTLYCCTSYTVEPFCW